MDSFGSEQGQLVRFVIVVKHIRVSSKVRNFWQSVGQTADSVVQHTTSSR